MRERIGKEMEGGKRRKKSKSDGEGRMRIKGVYKQKMKEETAG